MHFLLMRWSHWQYYLLANITRRALSFPMFGRLRKKLLQNWILYISRCRQIKSQQPSHLQNRGWASFQCVFIVFSAAHWAAYQGDFLKSFQILYINTKFELYGKRILLKNATKHPVTQFLDFVKQIWFQLDFQLTKNEIVSNILRDSHPPEVNFLVLSFTPA